ncbi:hypothetical protein ACSSNL_13300 [Thalassobius sp. S69A]|uniref:hypothetical protein n=1 Tax=unclassified Thalassovita TaxID=2619711 RepID=UPI003C7CC09E
MPAPQVPVTNDEFDINKVNEALAENYDNIEAHKSDADNPHGVTAAQIGAALDSDVQGILAVDVVRPGEDPTSFSADLTGDPAQRAVISDGVVVVDDDLGAVWSLPASASIAPRRAYAIEAGRIYRLRIVLNRLVDGTDPNNDAVEIRWQNLSKSKAAVSNVVLHLYDDLLIASGVQVYSVLISADVSGADYVPPATARYGLPEIRTYGSDGKLGVAAVVWDDVTEDIALQAALDGKATAAQGAKADTALQQADLDGHKAAADQHPISGVTGLQDDLDSKAPAAALAAEVAARMALMDAPAAFQSDALLEIQDAAGKILARVDKDAIWHMILAQLKRGDGLEVATFAQNDVPGLVVVGPAGEVVFDSRALPDTLATSDGIEIRTFVRNGASGAVVVDEAGNVLAEMEESDTSAMEDAIAALEAEVQTARGDEESLSARLASSLSPEGGLRVPRVNRDAMRQMRLRQAQLRAGTSLQINHVLCGDSFTHNWERWSGRFARDMVARYGDGGGGWTGYGYQGAYAGPYTTGGAQPVLVNGNARPDLYPITYDGSWDRVTLSPSPDMLYITSSTPGDKITREVPAAPDHTALRLVWIATADGVVRWRVDGGNWTALNVQGTFETIQWADIPLTAGAHSVEIEIVTGTVKLCGDNALSDAPGYRVHKIARSGSRVSQWVEQDEAQQRASWELLEATAWTYMEGTNSQTTPGQVTPATWRGQMAAMVTRMRAASVEADICLFMPPDNQRANNAHDMPEYADQARDLAYEMAVAFLDAQPAFGPDRMAYGHDQPFALFHTDLTHPNYDAGGVQLSSLAVEFHDFHPTILS